MPTVDAERWPEVAAVPRCSALRAEVTARVVRRTLDRLPMWVLLPDGSRLGRGGPVWELRDPDAFHRRLGRDGLIGFGESYMAGEWEAEDLVGVLEVFADQVTELVPPALRRLRRLWARRPPATQRNSRAGSRRNIHRHYDLSNELFALFLDETLSYSAALFRSLPARPELLADAQRRKVDALLDLAEVGPGTRLLEIGTGWGQLALQAARRGARVTTVTLSEEQRALARRRLAEAGVADRVSVELRDYRDTTGRYDAVVSVEMIEAVGEDYWPTYFRTLDQRLEPGGRVALQAITMPHDRLRETRGTFTWIQKYVFPGGLLPSTTAIEENLARHTGLRLTAQTGYGPHYAETLRLWRERFAAHADEVAALGFDHTFRRMWNLYLAYSEAGFRSRYLDVRQLQLTKEEFTR
ncbi:cyclopropane-fatty-acyl-phospholipid synthase family protein [Streptomyces sp. NPDC005438]|uniref:cyclopropane-fatty-acyl-phospholipid synthase family protein n=1 Tax=Streptomyces sp. NPDC005438 TaxID=3156880 RepID=UPI00339F598D